MDYKSTVIYCLKQYPELFYNRLQVDDQLFAVIGNGYKWQSGELVEYEDIEYPKENISDDIYNRYNNYEYPLKFHYGRKSLKKLYEEHPNMLKIIKPDYSKYPENDYYAPYPKNKQEFSIYPICKYSKLCRIPEDIKPDWLDAIEYFVDYCLNNQNILDKEDNQIEFLKIAKEKILKIRNNE